MSATPYSGTPPDWTVVVTRLPARKNRGAAIAGGLLLTALIPAAAAIAAPAASATPASPSAASQAGSPLGGQAAAAGAPGAGSVAWSAVGATPKGPDGRYQFVYQNIKPGTTIKDWVELYNKGATTAGFQVYGADATGTTPGNSLTYVAANKKSVDLGSWAAFYSSPTAPSTGQASFVIPGGHGIIEPFTIAVPGNAKPGDHTAGLMLQVGIPKINARGEHITVYSRIALPIELRVVGPLRAGLQVTSISTSFNNSVNPFGNGSARVTYQVTNTGNVRLSGTRALKVTGPFGISAAIAPQHLPTLLPGIPYTVTETAPGLYPAGPFGAHVTVTPSWPPTAQPLSLALPVATGNASFFAVPWAVLLLLLLLGGVGYGAWRFLKWRRREHAADLAAVADRARKETEQRLLGKVKVGVAAAGAAATAASAADAAGSADGAGGSDTPGRAGSPGSAASATGADSASGADGPGGGASEIGPGSASGAE
jgi:hypothetical protein